MVIKFNTRGKRGVILAKLNRAKVKKSITTALELPRDIMLDWPTVRMMGDEELVLSNHKGIAEYSKQMVRIKTSLGIVKITGDSLIIREIDREDIIILGKINAVNFGNR